MFGNKDNLAFRQFHALVEHYKRHEAARRSATYSAKLTLPARGYSVELLLIRADHLLIELTAPTLPPWPEGHSPLRAPEDDAPPPRAAHAPPCIALQPERTSLWPDSAPAPRQLLTGDADFDRLRAHSKASDEVFTDALHRLKVRQAVLGLIDLHVHPVRLYGPRYVVDAIARGEAVLALLRPARVDRLVRLMADLADALPPLRIDPTLPPPPPPRLVLPPTPPPAPGGASWWARLRARLKGPPLS